MECENLKNCPFYKDKMDIDSGVGKLYKERYCEGDKTKCARYQVLMKLGRPAVPNDLYPNMHERAEEIINKAK